jgi:hypothetical protein
VETVEIGEYMSKLLFLRNLFRIGEGICHGGFKEVNIKEFEDSDYYGGNFVSINALDVKNDHGFELKDYYSFDKPRRADVNVTAFRSFLFEMDSIGLEDQLKILSASEIPFSSIVYSGGKSYHAILSLENCLFGDLIEDEIGDKAKEYKRVWKRLRAKIDYAGQRVGIALPKHATSFVDSSCQNPSRFTRMPFELRDDKLQELVELGDVLSLQEFYKLLNTCPVIIDNVNEVKPVSSDVKNVSEFWHKCPVGLKNKLKYVDWAGSEGMYPELLKLTLWAIDSTGIDKDTMLEVLWSRTFLRLLDAGYPERKLTVAVQDAYNTKRRSS